MSVLPFLDMRARFAIASLTAVASLAFASADARAYCQTTTEKETAGYDPSVSGCWTTGAPLKWNVRDVNYSLDVGASTQVSLADATTVVRDAFGKWSTAVCATTDAGTTHPSITLHDVGPTDAAATDCGLVECDPTIHDTNHDIVFRDGVWPHNDPNNTLALTTVTYGIHSGEIFDADMEINSHDHKLSIASPTPIGAFDLGTILTHETGHFIGMAHSNQAGAVMFVRYVSGRMQLTPDDVTGVCTIYPPDSSSGSSNGNVKAGCACGTAQSDGATGATALGGAAALVLAATLRARRRRRAR